MCISFGATDNELSVSYVAVDPNTMCEDEGKRFVARERSGSYEVLSHASDWFNHRSHIEAAYALLSSAEKKKKNSISKTPIKHTPTKVLFTSPRPRTQMEIKVCPLLMKTHCLSFSVLIRLLIVYIGGLHGMFAAGRSVERHELRFIIYILLMIINFTCTIDYILSFRALFEWMSLDSGCLFVS